MNDLRVRRDSDVDMAMTTGEAPISEAPPVRTLANCGRLGVELQILGLLTLAWVLASVHAASWVLLAHPESSPPFSLFGRLAVPQFVALAAVSMRTLVDLPAARWDRTGSFSKRKLPWAFVAVGWLMGPIAVLMWLRDRTARERPPAPEQMVGAHSRLLRLPYWTALRFLAWASLAFVVSAMLLASERPAARELDVTLALVWAGAVAPIAALLAGALRRTLRPEVITVPTPIAPRRAYDVSVRLQLLTSVAAIGAIVTIAASGTLLSIVERGRDAQVEAARTAEALLALALAGNEHAVGRALAADPSLGMEIGGRRLGRGAGSITGNGAVDSDDDGLVDTWMMEDAGVRVAVPLTITTPIRTAPIALVSILAILAAAIAGVAIARDTQRDISRAISQVGAVAQGRAPPPLSMSALSTAEIRRFVQSVDRLVARITESNVEKYVAIEKAKEADRLKSQFLANMSHDLRSPLNSILGFSELLLSGIDGPLTDEQREMVAVIHTSGGELLQQIDDILDAAKLDAGRLELHPEPSPPVTLINRAIANARKRVGPNVRFEIDTAANLPPAFVDPYRTVQALENVLGFAAVRVEDGVIEVRAQLAPSGRRRMIIVEVRTPVAPASAAQLGTARRGFHRLPGHRGLGLSLPIAGAILELQGGTLSIRESKRKMVFRIELRALELRRTTDPPRSR
jgi:signal transduction histidine kinase